MYYKIPSYTMKCRLYLNKGQRDKVEQILYGIRVAHNCAIYDCVHNGRYLREYRYTDEGVEKVVHYVDVVEMAKSSYLKELRSEHEIINEVPASALSGNNGLFLNDIKKKFIDAKNGKNISIEAAINNKSVHYYSAKNPRRSYTYQESINKISFSENHNIFYWTLNKLGKVKIRGWNQKIRFTENAQLDFLQYVELLMNTNSKKQLTITIQKDNCDDYWISIKIPDVYIWKRDCTGNEVGLDVGIKDLLITSDGTKYENKHFKKQEKRHIRILNRRMSRRQGWSNIEFRNEYKKNQELSPSKGYQETKMTLAKAHRKIMWKRDNYNNNVTNQIVENSSYIGIESLNIKGMFRNRHLAYALSDAAMYDTLNKIQYKAKWYGRVVKEINQWTPSSKECNKCQYLYKGMTLSVREWTCPNCNTWHDRDINAAKNILKYSKNA